MDETGCPLKGGRLSRSEKMALGDEKQNGDENQQKCNFSDTNRLQLPDVLFSVFGVGQNSSII
ncbi:MAG: hypothetical protein HQ551_05895 [Desulfobacteraceae bacterium]|nr:hypothetical protein [Desulfobacteraceae bacterium]